MKFSASGITSFVAEAGGVEPLSLGGYPVYKTGPSTGLSASKTKWIGGGGIRTHESGKEFPFKGTGFNHFPTPPHLIDTRTAKYFLLDSSGTVR